MVTPQKKKISKNITIKKKNFIWFAKTSFTAGVNYDGLTHSSLITDAQTHPAHNRPAVDILRPQ